MSELAEYIETWHASVGDFLALLESLDDADWDKPTSLPGWDVRAIVSHTAHLERVLATGDEEHAEIGSPEHVSGLLGAYTEIGVVNRRTATPHELIEEIRTHTADRYKWLQANLPTDPEATPERIFGGVPWSWRVLLRNRPLDVWMHEQDIRRAVDRPGGLDTAGAQHTIDYLSDAFGFVVAKRAGAPFGTLAVLEVDGCPARAVEVGDGGRGRALPDVPDEATVRLSMSRDAFARLAGGRSDADPTQVAIEGDQELGAQIVAVMGTTP